ncbi:unnamed protein product [Dibothriocephalus latus]|uniref:Cytochrome c domain-containing protein n=1 Tax=Dibothriocephalus latus TaxID=60516 RepID=A0A3P7MGS6_DIBLA|nr:unnamed protein product [Dibothriocephalus latus]
MAILQTAFLLHSLCAYHKLIVLSILSQLLRRSSEVFQGKDGFVTLRDLFRWGERYRLANIADVPEVGSGARQQLFDWDAYLAEQGYLLLGGRARRPEEAAMVAEVIRKAFNRPIDEHKYVLTPTLFDHASGSSLAVAEFLSLVSPKDVSSTASTVQGGVELSKEFKHVVWTRDMRRLLVLVGNALKYKEPVLLVGETGCGKTTVCQIFANMRGQKLHCVNCHQYTEASDFLGGLRPVRGSDGPSGADSAASDSSAVDSGRLFEWVDGPLVSAMLSGDMPMPTVRDLLAWVEFMHNIANTPGSTQTDVSSMYTASCLHGASLLFLDSLQNTDDTNVEGHDVQVWFGKLREQRGKIADE